MCLILVAWRAHPDYPLVVAANRDEFFARPAAEAGWWPDAPSVFAGRDLEAGGDVEADRLQPLDQRTGGQRRGAGDDLDGGPTVVGTGAPGEHLAPALDAIAGAQAHEQGLAGRLQAVGVAVACSQGIN